MVVIASWSGRFAAAGYEDFVDNLNILYSFDLFSCIWTVHST